MSGNHSGIGIFRKQLRSHELLSDDETDWLMEVVADMVADGTIDEADDDA